MNVVTYSLVCYGLTTIISFMLVGLILILNKAMSKSNGQNGAEGQE